MFGHLLIRFISASRGPPGVSFEVTSDGNYDIDKKKFCNVQDAEELHDAVNLRLVQQIIQNEVRTHYQVTLSMSNEIDNNNIMLRILEESINEKIKNLQIDTQQHLSLRNAEI